MFCIIILKYYRHIIKSQNKIFFLLFRSFNFYFKYEIMQLDFLISKNLRSDLSELSASFEQLKSQSSILIKTYENDDTSKFKLRYDRLASRYNDLSNRY
jgi:hypothetical protein